MSSLLSSAEKLAYSSAINDIADTFARNITIWQKSSENIVIQNNDDTNDDYDAFYDKPVGSTSTINYTPVSGVFPARIKYIDRTDNEFLAIASSQNEINVTDIRSIVRIKVRQDAAGFMEDAEKITVDNNDYRLLTSYSPHGLFSGLDYYTFYLTKLN